MNPRLKEIEKRKKEIRALLEGTEQVDLNALETELKALDAEKEQIEKRAALAAQINSEAPAGEPAAPAAASEARSIPKPGEGIPAEARTHKPLIVFRNFAEQLRAVKRFASNGVVDERLNQLMNESRAALGMNVSIDSDGGFAVQTDFAGMIMDSAAKAGDILSRVDKYPISGNADGVKWNDIDETNIGTTVFGGVRVYWAAEAEEVTAASPKIRERKLELLKLMGVAYATYEMEKDTSFVSELYTRAFTLAINRELEACAVAGTGAGKPLGFLNSSAKVTVSKETSQAADTIMWQNISKMYNRALGDKSKYVWLVHPDCHEQFDFMQFPVGTGGVPVYLQAALAGSVDTLKGKPVIDSDQCSALGDLGDINFVDLSDYLMIYKGGIDAISSIHVEFLSAQNCFRFIFRANGMPKKSSAVTIKNSSNDRSTFVTLQAR